MMESAQAVANEYRADLEAAGIGSGRHGYRYSFPKPILDPDRVSVVISED